MQGLLSYLHDAHFQGRNRYAQIADRSSATFLSFCQPIKFAFCKMDPTQVALLVVFLVLGLLCFRAGTRAVAAGDAYRYQVFHSLWHLLLPLGGVLWIEYTQALVLSRQLSIRGGLLPAAALGSSLAGALNPAPLSCMDGPLR